MNAPMIVDPELVLRKSRANDEYIANSNTDVEMP